MAEGPLRDPAAAGDATPGGAPRRRPSLPVLLVATALGAGLVPRAPGTCGTLVAVPLCWWLARLGLPWYLGVTALVIAVGSWAADKYCNATGRHDNQQIVIDEVAGYLVTMALGPHTPSALVIGFFAFRLFDIWKPWPVRWIDRRVHGGFGVVADDLGAGVYAAVVVLLLARFGVVGFLDAALGW